VEWNSIDWDVLERLRAHFLDRETLDAPYWRDTRDLAMYDFTFGRRIAWKWAAVLEPLFRRGWKPPARRLVDWGCGSGIAARSLLAHAPSGSFREILLWDHSATATTFAANRIAEKFPEVTVHVGEPSSQRDAGDAFVLVISHVINELAGEARADLLTLARSAAAIVWIEPGTTADSHALIAIREELRADFHCLAPCPHNGRCGLLTANNQRHWCHHFARPPTEVFTDSGWAKFSRQLEIDLRSLPYSHLVMDRRTLGDANAQNRIIGEPRKSAGLMRILRCRAENVQEVELQKRDHPALWKTLQKGAHDGIFTWSERDGRIQATKP